MAAAADRTVGWAGPSCAAASYAGLAAADAVEYVARGRGATASLGWRDLADD